LLLNITGTIAQYLELNFALPYLTAMELCGGLQSLAGLWRVR
jgi:hypothetical protein